MSKKIKTLIILVSIFILTVITGTIYEVSTWDNVYYKDEKNLKIPIFVYHDIVTDESQIEYDYMQTTKDTFEKQITGLMKLGYHPISYQDLIDYNNGEKALYKHSFIITFDDGDMGVYENAFPISKEYNIPMTSFVINEQVGKPGYYTWEQAKEMQESGLIDICSHSMKHIEYDKVSKEELEQDVVTSFEEIDNNTGITAKRVFCYPYGLYSNEGRERLKELQIVQNLTDNKINNSKNLDLSGLHREYPLSDSVLKIIIKMEYRNLRYGG